MSFTKLFFLGILVISIKSYEVYSAVLELQYRLIEPELTIVNHSPKGPLVDIISEACRSLNIDLIFVEVPFARSIKELETGKTDIVPRLLKTEEREKFSYFLGPIALQTKVIYFIKHKNDKRPLVTYDDLKKFKIGIKRGAIYFEKFKNDDSLNKITAKNDEELATFFIEKKVDAVVLFDKKSIENEFSTRLFSSYVYAEYRYERQIINYYGFSKKSKHLELFDKLNKKLEEMKLSGRISKIYKQYNIDENNPG